MLKGSVRLIHARIQGSIHVQMQCSIQIQCKLLCQMTMMTIINFTTIAAMIRAQRKSNAVYAVRHAIQAKAMIAFTKRPNRTTMNQTFPLYHQQTIKVTQAQR